MPLGSGRKVVTSHTVPEALEAESTRCTSVHITALTTNTKPVVVGDDQIVGAPGTRRGTSINPGLTERFYAGRDGVDDLGSVFVCSEVDGEGVSYTYGFVE